MITLNATKKSNLLHVSAVGNNFISKEILVSMLFHLNLHKDIPFHIRTGRGRGGRVEIKFQSFPERIESMG